MDVSIIIPAYNAAATLDACLAACTNQTYAEVEVIVVDDGSTDETPRIAQAYPVCYMQQENAGPAAARNRGASAAKGDVVVFTDADCVPEAGWIEALVAGFSEEVVVGVGGTYGIANAESLLARMVHEEIAVRHGQYGEEVDFLGSFNVAYRREAFEAAGGFDESFREASGEDNDLAYRLIDRGGQLRFSPEAVVKHYHPCRLWPYLRTQMRHGYWRVKLYTKHAARTRGGDQYAGLGELVAPPLALAVVMLLALVALSALWPPAFRWVAGLTAVVGAFFVGLRLPMPVQMMRRTGDARMLTFVVVMVLRDIARGAGMVLGGWIFVVRGGAQA